MQKYIFFIMFCVFDVCLSMASQPLRLRDLVFQRRAKQEQLNRAVFENNKKEVKVLILQGDVSLDEHNDVGMTPLMIAAAVGNIDMAYLLLRSGATVNYQTISQGTALSVAVRHNQLKMAQVLFIYQAQVNQGNKYSQHTPLMEASKKGHVPIMTRLHAYGADPTLKDLLCKDTALYWAVVCQQQEAALVLLEDKRINVNDTVFYPKTTLLHMAAQYCNISIMQLLIKHGANLFALDYKGQKPSESTISKKAQSFLQHEEWLDDYIRIIAPVAYALKKKFPGLDLCIFQYEVSQYLGCLSKK